MAAAAASHGWTPTPEERLLARRVHSVLDKAFDVVAHDLFCVARLTQESLERTLFRNFVGDMFQTEYIWMWRDDLTADERATVRAVPGLCWDGDVENSDFLAADKAAIREMGREPVPVQDDIAIIAHVQVQTGDMFWTRIVTFMWEDSPALQQLQAALQEVRRMLQTTVKAGLPVSHFTEAVAQNAIQHKDVQVVRLRLRASNGPIPDPNSNPLPEDHLLAVGEVVSIPVFVEVSQNGKMYQLGTSEPWLVTATGLESLINECRVDNPVVVIPRCRDWKICPLWILSWRYGFPKGAAPLTLNLFGTGSTDVLPYLHDTSNDPAHLQRVAAAEDTLKRFQSWVPLTDEWLTVLCLSDLKPALNHFRQLVYLLVCETLPEIRRLDQGDMITWIGRHLPAYSLKEGPQLKTKTFTAEFFQWTESDDCALWESCSRIAGLVGVTTHEVARRFRGVDEHLPPSQIDLPNGRVVRDAKGNDALATAVFGLFCLLSDRLHPSDSATDRKALNKALNRLMDIARTKSDYPAVMIDWSLDDHVTAGAQVLNSMAAAHDIKENDWKEWLRAIGLYPPLLSDVAEAVRVELADCTTHLEDLELVGGLLDALIIAEGQAKAQANGVGPQPWVDTDLVVIGAGLALLGLKPHRRLTRLPYPPGTLSCLAGQLGFKYNDVPLSDILYREWEGIAQAYDYAMDHMRTDPNVFRGASEMQLQRLRDRTGIDLVAPAPTQP